MGLLQLYTTILQRLGKTRDSVPICECVRTQLIGSSGALSQVSGQILWFHRSSPLMMKTKKRTARIFYKKKIINVQCVAYQKIKYISTWSKLLYILLIIEMNAVFIVSRNRKHMYTIILTRIFWSLFVYISIFLHKFIYLH